MHLSAAGSGNDFANGSHGQRNISLAPIKESPPYIMNKILLALILVFSSNSIFSAYIAHAEESVVNNVKDSAGDAKTNVKKAYRKTRRKIRMATGNDTVLKDTEDKLKDMGDDLSNSSDKIKRNSKSKN